MSLISSLHRVAAVTACTLTIGLVLPGTVSAHSAFLGATPAVGQRVEASPSELVLRFTERLNQKLTRVTVEPVAGGTKARATLTFRRDTEIVVTPQPALLGGAYVVRWQAAGLPIDPVCRMAVEPERSAGTVRHRDAEFHFCSPECIATFTANPDRYAGA